MGRAPCCDKATVKKGPWAPEEDAVLKAYIDEHGAGGNWIQLPHKIGRSSSQLYHHLHSISCRLQPAAVNSIDRSLLHER
jgi:hypothetical protein